MTLLPPSPEEMRRLEPSGAPRIQRIPTELEETESRPVSLPVVIGALRRRLWLVLATAAIGAGLAWYWVQSTPTTYTSTAVLLLKDARRALTGTLAGSASDQLGGRMLDPVQSQVEILTSRTIASEVVDSVRRLRVGTSGFPDSLLRAVSTSRIERQDSLGLVFSEFDFTARNGAGQQRAMYGEPVELGGLRFTIARRPEAASGALIVRSRNDAVERLLGRVRVRPRENTEVVDVVYADYDPVLAQQVTRALSEIFRSSNANRAKQESVRRRVFIEGQLRQNDSLLNQARAALSDFRGRQKAFSTKLKLSTEQADLNAIEMRRGEMDADRRMFREMLTRLETDGASREQIGALMSAPGLASNAVLTGLYSQLTHYQSIRDSLISGRFGATANHPDVRRLDALVVSTEDKMVTALRSVVTSLDARIAALDGLRTSNATDFPALSTTEQEEARLEEQEGSARKMVTELRAEYEKARLSEAVEVGQVEILDGASVGSPVFGVGPVRMTAFGLMLGLIIGGGIAFALDRLDTSIRAGAQVRTRLGLPELAVIPPIVIRRHRSLPQRNNRLTHRKLSPRTIQSGRAASVARLGGEGLILASDLHSIAAEAYRLLRTNLLFSLPDGPLRTVLVTSPAPGDGKTTVAANLAIAFAHQGMRVLLVDADLRRGRVHTLFHLPREPGLSQVLTGEIPLSSAVRPTPVTGLFALPTGSLPYAPNELVGTVAMRSLLTEAAREYAVVVLDSPPVLAASDASIISTISDATIVVVRAGRTHEEEALVTVGQLTAVGGNVVGAVLNDPDAAVKYSAGYYQYAGYYGKA